MVEPAAEPANRSLAKYGLMIEEFGGWDLYEFGIAGCGRIPQ
jgi:hypothetical protein